MRQAKRPLGALQSECLLGGTFKVPELILIRFKHIALDVVYIEANAFGASQRLPGAA